MASSVPEDQSHYKETPIHTINDYPRVSFANQHVEMITNPERTSSTSSLGKSVDKISTYYIWSILNLLLLPFGLICCLFSHKISQFKIQNRYEMAKKWSRRTFVLNLVTTLLLFGVIITIVMLRYDFEQRHIDPQANQTLTTIYIIPWQPGH